MGHKVKQSLMSSRIDFFYYAFRNVLLVSVPLLVISTFVLGFSVSHSSATNSGSDNLAITISSSCTLSSVVNVPHNAEVYNGNYLGDIGKTTITTLCNDGNGYSVYAMGYSNNEEGNNKLINSERPEYSIDTGLDTSGLTSAWAMKLNNIPDDPSPTPPTIESDYNNTYGIVPSYWTKVAGRQSGTTDMAEGSSFTTTYAVYASSSQYAGTYVGQVKYALLHPYKNENMLTIEDAFALSGKNKINISGVGEYYAMQDMSPNICNAARITNEISQTQLVDIRDNKLYWVAKLDDGHCWMTQNLDFNIEANTVLDSNTTDLNVAYDSSTGQYAEYNDGYTESNGVIYYVPASSANTIDFTDTTVSGWQNSNTTPYTANKTDSTKTGHASLGNYYNWSAAIASNNSSSLTQDTLSDISNNPKNSICPKGWRLPTISNQSEASPGSTNEFARLNYLYNGGKTSGLDGLLSSPLYIVGVGAISGSSHSWGMYEAGYYWTSTDYNVSNTWYFHFNAGGSILPKYNGRPKADGFSLRCVTH